MRVVRPELVKSFAERHNVGLWKCLADILHLSGNWDVTTKEVASMPLAMGGLGLRDGARISPAAFWASWADSLGMIKARHPQVADTIMQGLNGEAAAPTLRAAARARHDLTGVQGFEPPSWEALADGVRLPFHDMDDGEPGVERHGWQHEAASRLEWEFRERHLMPHLAAHERALVRSQSGPFAGMAFSSAPSSHLQRIDSHLFRVLLLRRLRLPLPLSARSCRCGRLLDSLGHHRASCSRAGVLGRRGFVVESTGARICREAGGRVTTNVMMRDLDLPVPHASDQRRLEIVADGLPLFGSVQLAVDTPLRWNTTPRSGQRRRCSFGSRTAQEGVHLS